MSHLLVTDDERELAAFLCGELGAKLLLEDVVTGGETNVADDPLPALPSALPSAATYAFFLKGTPNTADLRAPYPFTAPAVSPWIRWRCRKLNSTATGTVLRITPADSGPHCTSYCPTM